MGKTLFGNYIKINQYYDINNMNDNTEE